MNTLLKTYEFPARPTWEKLLQRPAFNPVELQETVREILLQVKTNGDQALFDLTAKFDGVSLPTLKVSAIEIESVKNQLSSELKKAIESAAANIQKFHAVQLEKPVVIETQPGVKCWRKSVGIERVGLYIPGGSAPLFSTVLMLGIPAQIAGCKEVLLCTPPEKDGNINPAILFAAQLVGITNIYKVGGAQAIAAMAYGTETIGKCYKLFGPGNQYVTCAKTLVNLDGTAIDMPAGPSELAVIADESAKPAFVAADLLSQAEHGADSQVLLFTTNAAIIEPIQVELNKQLENLPRKETAAIALSNSTAFVLSSNDELMDMVNDYAPEHLIIATADAPVLADKVINAGSVFLGNYTPESAGDYASGTNHTLPTGGFAKTYSGVSVDSFVKKITFQEITAAGITNLGSTIEIMAEAEGLVAHKNAVSIRLEALNRG